MKTLSTVILAALLAAACQGAPPDTADAEKPDPRQGKEVNQICFQSQIRSWKENDRNSIIVERGMKDEYKLELVGPCQPDEAFTSIGLISRGGGSCLSQGDRLVTDARFNNGSCLIRAIHEWNKDVKPADETSK